MISFKKNKFFIFVFFVFYFLAASVYAISPDKKTLRVGTTGDYPPFTEYNKQTGELSGFDIIMARLLGKNLGYNVVFIRTTWPMLSHDLAAQKFDIAMSGISATPEREKSFLISEPLLQDGKVPLVRCGEIKKYRLLQQINNSSVRVVENKGGTNLQFAQQFLPRAKLIIVNKNEITSEYLLKNKADVMITDRIEAIYRQKNIPGLCVANKTLLTKNNKIYLIDKDNPRLLSQVNLWLATLKKNGQLNQMIKKYID